jgi:hypothetical protein
LNAATLAHCKALAADAIGVQPVLVTPIGRRRSTASRVLSRRAGPDRPPLRRPARHRLPGPPGPARGGTLARLRPVPSARRRGPRHLQRLTQGLRKLTCPCNFSPISKEPGQRYFREFSPGDDFYEALIDTHRDLSDEQSEALNARLILLLANQIGDIGVLREALALARQGV